MAENKWCRQLPNGDPKPSWLVNCIPQKKIPGPGIYIPPPSPQPPPPVFTACRYNQLENADWVINQLNCGGGEYSEFTFSATSLIVNGVEYITSPIVSPTIDINTVNYVSANNIILSGCTVGVDPTGVTYTNFVDFVNSVFTSFSLDSYTAQLSYTNFSTTFSSETCALYSVNVTGGVGCSISYNSCNGTPISFPVSIGTYGIQAQPGSISVGSGLNCAWNIPGLAQYNANVDTIYIIYPENDTFTLRLLNNALGPGTYIEYSNTGLTSNNFIVPTYWSTFECGYSVTNGQVIE